MPFSVVVIMMFGKIEGEFQVGCCQGNRFVMLAICYRLHFLENVPSQESPLASGMASARVVESAEAMPEVPKGR